MTARKRTARQTEGNKPRIHPFALAHDTLMEELGKLSGSLLVENASLGTLTLRLPSTAKGPQPSPELSVEKESEDSRAATEFKWWEVVTLTLDGSLALDFFLSLPNNPPYSTTFGGSLRFWAQAARFAFELITRQCFVPTLQETKRGNVLTCRATWEVVLAEEDTERMARLASMMPPLCWASMPPGDKRSAVLQDLVHHFL